MILPFGFFIFTACCRPCSSRWPALGQAAPLWTRRHYTILYDTILYYTILYYNILYYTVQYCTVLYYTLLYYTVLYCTILYLLQSFRTPQSSMFQCPEKYRSKQPTESSEMPHC